MARLIADIGGTNARFALAGDDGEPLEIRRLKVADYQDLAAAARAYLGDRRPPKKAVIAVATAVESDEVRLTNSPWKFGIEATRRALGLERLAVINDFVAQALAMPDLGPGDREQLGGGEPVAGRVVGVIGPGTGLGVSALFPSGRRWLPVPSEGGHVSLAPVTARERALLERLAARFEHVSLERAVSGPGLLNLAQAIAETDGVGCPAATPEEVTARARAEDCAVCGEALRVFSGLLGGAAGDLALTLGARGGIYIGGGLCASLGPLFDRAAFRRRFEAKGRLAGYVAPIPVWLATRGDTGLLGAARYPLQP